jgi:hypothetical protein
MILSGSFVHIKGCGLPLVSSMKSVDGFLKFLEGTEDAPLETPFGEQREQAFDGIEPGC